MDTEFCKICSNKFSSTRSLGIHIRVSHKIGTDEYFCKYLGNDGKCKFCFKPTSFINLKKGFYKCCSNKCAKKLACTNPEYIRNISEKTKIAMSRPDVKDKINKKIGVPRTKEVCEKISKSCSGKFDRDHTLRSRMYTKERNKKISESKILFWRDNEEGRRRVGNIWKIWKNRDEVGWRKHLLYASKKGFEKIFSPTGDTSLEIKIYDMMLKEGINFIKKYELEGKIYDALLTDYNILLEIDGEFWHKSSIDECKYEFQKESFYNDLKKKELAEQNNFRLIRIPEHNIPKTIKELLPNV